MRYASDISSFLTMSLPDFYAMVSRIPYRPDFLSSSTEILHRPALTLMRAGVSADCDDKAITMAAWAQRRGIPWRFKAVGYGSEGFTHVYNEFMLEGRWLPVDATYERNTLFREQPYRRSVNG